MLKVKLKFSVDQIVAISFLLNKLYNLNFSSLSPEEKIEISIGTTLSDRFDKKKRTLQQKLDLLNSTKKITITLWYFEAWALKNIFFNQIFLMETDYQKLNIQNSLNIIDKKVK